LLLLLLLLLLFFWSCFWLIYFQATILINKGVRDRDRDRDRCDRDDNDLDDVDLVVAIDFFAPCLLLL